MGNLISLILITRVVSDCIGFRLLRIRPKPVQITSTRGYFNIIMEGIKNNSIATAHSTVFKESVILGDECIKIEGYDFNRGLDYPSLLSSMFSTGFQASHLGEAIQIVNKMLNWRLADDPIAEDCSEDERDLKYRESVKCKVFLGFSPDMVLSGIRDTIRYLVEHHMVDVLVTTGRGVEEDLIKCLAATDGNLKLSDWLKPIVDQMLKEQSEQNVLWTPSKLIQRLGKEINDKRSYLYKNDIPVFCPGLMFSVALSKVLKSYISCCPRLTIDEVEDIWAMNGQAMDASRRKTGMIILGLSIAKHHICSDNLFLGGADYAVFINTSHEFDGCDSRSSPDEAVSWGKIGALRSYNCFPAAGC